MDKYQSVQSLFKGTTKAQGQNCKRQMDIGQRVTSGRRVIVSTCKGFMYYFRDASGKFPEYPPAEDGGSALIFQDKDPAELEIELKAKVRSELQLMR